MNAIELSQLNCLLDALQSAPNQVNFTMGFVAASEVSNDMLQVLVRIWSSYCEGLGILKEVEKLRQELL